MKKLILTAIITFLGLQTNAKPLTQTDLGKVFNSGSSAGFAGVQTKLAPGVYIIGDEDHKWSGTDYLIVDKYVNDDDKVIAIMVRQENIEDKRSGTGRFYIGKSIKGGTSIMLSPLFIDTNGNVAIESEVNDKAAVIEVSVQNNSKDYRYPFILQGHNGALNGQLLGMRASTSSKPSLTPWPKNNIFQTEDENNNLVVSGSTVAFHSESKIQQRFELLPMNGVMGKFAELVSTELNTMGEYMVSDSEVKRLAFFMKNTNGREVFVVANPTMTVGEFRFTFYGPKCRTFTDYFFSGGLIPGH